MFRLARYLKHYILESILGPLFKLTEATFELIVPLVMADIIDKGIRNADKAYILKMGAVLVGLGLLGLICAVTAQYFAAKASMGLSTALRADLFRHIGRFSYTQLDEAGTSALITRMTSDINQVQNGVNMLLRLFLRSPFIAVGAIVMAYIVSPKITLIFVASAVLFSLIIGVVMRLTVPMYGRIQKKLDRLALLTREGLAGSRVIRAFSRQNAENAEFAGEAGALADIQKKAGRISAVMNPLTYAVVNAAIILILWQGGHMVNTGSLTQGKVIALINYMGQILLALIYVVNLIVIITKSAASAKRLNAVLDIAPAMEEGTCTETDSADEFAVEFTNADFSYSSTGERALEGISFAAKAGETIGVIGATGAGKTTLVSLIPRFYDTIGGEVRVFGHNVRDYTFQTLRGMIAVAVQKSVLFSGTVRENLLWGNPNAPDEILLDALKTAQAYEFVMALDGGLDARVAQGGANFSGGQLQRLNLARALVREPRILILDDTSSALDYATDAAMRRALKTRHALQADTQGMTVFIVSQRIAAVRDADKIIVLDDGKLVGAGIHGELFASCAVYREICDSQQIGQDGKSTSGEVRQV